MVENVLLKKMIFLKEKLLCYHSLHQEIINTVFSSITVFTSHWHSRYHVRTHISAKVSLLDLFLYKKNRRVDPEDWEGKFNK